MIDRLEALRMYLLEHVTSLHVVSSTAHDATALSLPPSYALVFSSTDGLNAAVVTHQCGEELTETWRQGLAKHQQALRKKKVSGNYFRVDWVQKAEAVSFSQLEDRIASCKRNYYRHGLALDAPFNFIFTEMECNSHEFFYPEHENTNRGQLRLDALRAYSKQRFPRKKLPLGDTVWILSTAGVFSSEQETLVALPGPDDIGRLPSQPAPKIAGASFPSLYTGVRRCDFGPGEQISRAIESSSRFLAKEMQNNGRFIYGYFPVFNSRLKSYNTVRHAGVLFSLMVSWEFTQLPEVWQAIESGIHAMTSTMIKHSVNSNNEDMAFLLEGNGEVKLGGLGVALVALGKYTHLSGKQDYLPLMRALGRGLEYMQQIHPAKDNNFVHVLNANDLSLKSLIRTIYYDGEALFGIMQLYAHDKDERWLSMARRALDRFIEMDHWKAHDHWLAYAANEITLHCPEERYFRFGLQNVRGHLNFICQRETTYPTLMELSMAAAIMVDRIQKMPDMRHLLDDFPLQKFQHAIDVRANYLLMGYFWPEMAMFFPHANFFTGTFFIRHHHFRCRIDDVGHYLAGLTAYMLHYKQKEHTSHEDSEAVSQLGASISFVGDINLSRRQHFLTRQRGINNIFDVRALRESDLTIGNLECVVATSGEPTLIKGESAPFYFRARPEMVNLLQVGNISVVATANNHSMDYGPEALLEQMHILDAAGIAHTGAGADLKSASRPVYKKVNGINVAIFALDATFSAYALTEKKPGIWYLPQEKPETMYAELQPRIRQARECGADIVLVCVHWKHSGRPRLDPGALQRKACYAILEAGADAILGSAAHNLQGVEIYNNKPIIHDAGNFLFDAMGGGYALSGIFTLTIKKAGVSKLTFSPVCSYYGYTKDATGEDAQKIIDTFCELSEKLGTQFARCATNSVCIDLAVHGNGLALGEASMCFQTADPNKPLIEPCAQPRKEWVVEELPTDAHKADVLLGPLRLVGYKVDEQCKSITSRRSVFIDTYWRIEKDFDQDALIGIHLQTQDKPVKIIFGNGQDHEPCDWQWPTSRWSPGRIYKDRYALRPTVDLTQFSNNTPLSVCVYAHVETEKKSYTCTSEQVILNMHPEVKKPAVKATTVSPYFFLRTLGYQLEGLAISAFLRAKLFKECLHLDAVIATTAYNPDQYTFYKMHMSKGLMPSGTQYLNMYDYYQGVDRNENAAPQPASVAFPAGCTIAPVPNTHDKRVRVAGIRVMYLKYNDDGTLDYVNHFEKNMRVRRDKYDPQGFLSRTRYFDAHNNVTKAFFYRKDGTAAITIHYNNDGEKVDIQSITLLDNEGKVLATFKNEQEMTTYWLLELFQDTEKCFFCVIDRSIAYKHYAQKNIHLPNVYSSIIVHGKHFIGVDPMTAPSNGYYSFVLNKKNSISKIISLTAAAAHDTRLRHNLDNVVNIPHTRNVMPLRTDVAVVPKRVVHIGRLTDVKRQDLLLEAFAEVVKKVPDAELLIYGEGELKQHLQSIVSSLQLEKNVFFKGTTHDVDSVFASSALSVLTSVGEAFPLVLLESLSNGCPPIAFDVRYGPSDMIKNGENGYLVPFPDVKALAEKIIYVLENPEERQRLSINARKSIEQNFAPDKVKDSWKSLINEAMKIYTASF